jgi:uncharacterized protein involved in exopolysaccharide biosynthesis
VLFRQRWVMLAAFAIVVIGVLISGVWLPKYEAHMKILVRRQRMDAIVSPQANVTAQYNGDQVSEEDINSEVELLNSEDLLRKVVMTNGLQEKHGFSLGRDDEQVRVATAVQWLSKDLKIEPLRKTNVISVSYQSRDPHMATKVLQALSAAYTEKHLEVHRPSGEFKFFDQQTEQYRQGLAQAQQRLTEFTKENGIVSAQLEREQALQRVNEFEAEARQAQAAVAENEHRIRSLQAQLQLVQPRITTVVRTSENPQLMQQLKSTLLDLELKRTELLTKYDPSYRLVQEIDKKIAEARAAIASEENQPVREETTDKNPNYQWIQAELTKAQAEVNGLEARTAAAGSIAAQYREAARQLNQSGVVQQDLLREAKTEEENYLLYVRKREEARISDALDLRGILNVAIAEQPVVPALPSRSPLSAAMFTLLLGLSVSICTAFVVDFVDPSFRTPDELAGYLGSPVLAALPKGEK